MKRTINGTFPYPCDLTIKMATKISIHDFTFLPLGCDKYLVEYKGPVSGQTWRQHITNAALIAATKDSISPKPKSSNVRLQKQVPRPALRKRLKN